MPGLGNSNNLNMTITSEANTEGITKTESSVNSLEEKSKSLTASLGNLTKAFVFGNVIYSLTSDAAIKVKETFSEIVKASEEWQSQQAALNAALASTHDASGLSTKDAIDYAEAISNSTPITREAALAGENMLLTFTNIHKNVFPQTTQAVADMATAMNHGLTPSAQELSSTAIMVGKALNDPENGLTRLQRVGVMFTDKQKDLIKSLQDSGDVAGAQTVILDELAREFGGRASAGADTFRGKVEMLKNRITDLGVDGIGNLNKRLNDLAYWWNIHQAAIKKVADQVLNFLEPSFIALWNTITQKVLPVIDKLWHEVIEPLIPIIGTLFVAAIWLAINAFNAFLKTISPIIDWMLNHKWIVEALAGAFGVLAASMAFGTVTAAFSGAIGGAMVTMETMRLVTIPGLIASLSTLAAGFAIPAAAAVVAGIVIINAANQAKAAWDRTSAAVSSAGNSEDDAIRKINNSSLSATQKANEIRSLFGSIPGHATGVKNYAGGWTMLGENGPELGYLPPGSSVYTNSQSKSMAASQPTGNVYKFGDIYLGDASAVNQFAQWTKQLNNDGLLASKGLTVRQGA